jgi:hypothetical protein
MRRQIAEIELADLRSEILSLAKVEESWKSSAMGIIAELKQSPATSPPTISTRFAPCSSMPWIAWRMTAPSAGAALSSTFQSYLIGSNV